MLFVGIKMGELLKPILKAPAVVSFLRLVKGFGAPFLCRVIPNQIAEPSVQPDLNVLNCRVKLIRQEKDKSVFDVFTMEICGSVHAPSDMDYMIVRISIIDVTDGVDKAKPVHSRVKQWQMQDSPVFVYSCDVGKLPNAETTLSDLVAVGQVQLDWLTFPRKGKRDLQFSTSIWSRESGKELAFATCTFTYENATLGYIDLQENIQRAKTLAVALAFAVSAADKKLYDCEVELIKNWARGNIDFSQASNRAKRKLEKALKKTICFFHEGNQLNAQKICEEIVENAPVAARYDVLELCLRVAQANGVATVEELTLLKKLASWLEIDTNRFRSMMEKILPANIHEVEDVEIILGVTPNMSEDETRQHLNKEYRKWNARVTNFDPEIQTRADHMLNFITKARGQYIG